MHLVGLVASLFWMLGMEKFIMEPMVMVAAVALSEADKLVIIIRLKAELQMVLLLF